MKGGDSQWELTGRLHALVAGIEKPENLFSGLRCGQGLSPDSVILFRRTHTEAFKPTGSVTNFHHRFELVVLLKQGGPVRIGETAYQLEPGECALIFPHQFHHYMDVESGPLEWLFLTFELDDPKSIESLRDDPRCLDAVGMELLEKIAVAYLRGLPSDPLSVSYHLSRLLLHLDRAPRLPRERRSIHSVDDKRDLIVQQVNLYLRQHLEKAPSLKTVASDLGYSTSHLRTLFREKLGVSLGLYIRESRLAQAARLLLTTDKTVAAVAGETGFASVNAFSRAFANSFGVAPKAYAQKFSPGDSQEGAGAENSRPTRKTR